MKKTFSLLGLFAASLTACVDKQNDASYLLRTHFPQLKNTVMHYEPSLFDEFGILMDNAEGDNAMAAYLVGEDTNHNGALEKDEIASLHLVFRDTAQDAGLSDQYVLKRADDDSYQIALSTASIDYQNYILPELPLANILDPQGAAMNYEFIGDALTLPLDTASSFDAAVYKASQRDIKTDVETHKAKQNAWRHTSLNL